jgi:hypothetical protein
MIDARDTIHLTCPALFGELHAQVTFHTRWDYAWVVHDIALFADAACSNLLADDIHLDDFTPAQQRLIFDALTAAERARRQHYSREVA